MDKQKLQINKDVDQESSKVGFLFLFAIVLIGSSGIFAPTFYPGESNQRVQELDYKQGTTFTSNRQTGRYLKIPSRF
jgi:hypothetical protein